MFEFVAAFVECALEETEKVILSFSPVYAVDPPKLDVEYEEVSAGLVPSSNNSFGGFGVMVGEILSGTNWNKENGEGTVTMPSV
jgi:hypothetical protein